MECDKLKGMDVYIISSVIMVLNCFSFFLFEHHIAVDPVWSFQPQWGLMSSYGHSRSDKLQKTFSCPVPHMAVFMCRHASDFLKVFPASKVSKHKSSPSCEMISKCCAATTFFWLKLSTFCVYSLQNEEKQTTKRLEMLNYIHLWIKLWQTCAKSGSFNAILYVLK